MLSNFISAFLRRTTARFSHAPATFIGVLVLVFSHPTAADAIQQVISIHIGRDGVGAGNQYWEQLFARYGILADGQMPSDTTIGYEDDEWNRHFSETGAGKHVPRAIFIDWNPNSINAIRTGSFSQAIHPEQLLSGSVGGVDMPTYAEGRYSYGIEIIDLTLDRIRKLADNCTEFQGFQITTGAGDGFGSGFTALLMERLRVDYSNKIIHAHVILPTKKTVSSSAYATYNTTLLLPSLITKADRAYFYDSANICRLDRFHPKTNVVNGRIYGFVATSMAGISAEAFTQNLFEGAADHFIVPVCTCHTGDDDREEENRAREDCAMLMFSEYLLHLGRTFDRFYRKNTKVPPYTAAGMPKNEFIDARAALSWAQMAILARLMDI